MLKIKKICTLSAFLMISSHLSYATASSLMDDTTAKLDSLKAKFELGSLEKQTFEERRRAIENLRSKTLLESSLESHSLDPQKLKQNPLLEEEPISKLAALCLPNSNPLDADLKTKMTAISETALSSGASIFSSEIAQLQNASPYQNIKPNSHVFIQKLLTNFQKILSDNGLNSATVHQEVFAIIDQKFKLWIQMINRENPVFQLSEEYGLKGFLEKYEYQTIPSQKLSTPPRRARGILLKANAPVFNGVISSAEPNRLIQPLRRVDLFKEVANDSILTFPRGQSHRERFEDENIVFPRTSIHLDQRDVQRPNLAISSHFRGHEKDSITRSDFSGSSFNVSSRLFHATKDLSHEPERERVVSNHIGSNAFVHPHASHTSPSTTPHQNKGLSKSPSSVSEFGHIAQRGNVRANDAIQKSSVHNDRQTLSKTRRNEFTNRQGNSENPAFSKGKSRNLLKDPSFSKRRTNPSEKVLDPNGNKLGKARQKEGNHQMKKGKEVSKSRGEKVKKSLNKNYEKALANQKIVPVQPLVEDEQDQKIIQQKKKKTENNENNEISSTQEQILNSSFKIPVASQNNVTIGLSAFEESNLSASDAITVFQQA